MLTENGRGGHRGRPGSHDAANVSLETVLEPQGESEGRVHAAEPKPALGLAVLVADDNATTRSVIAKVLEKAGHRPRVVEDGQAAAEAFAKDRFDAVILNLDAPVLNGVEAAKLIRFLSTERAPVPVLALVSKTEPPHQEDCEAAGIGAMLAKPLDPAMLLATLEAAVSAKRIDRLPASAQRTGTPDSTDGVEARPSALDVRTLEALKALGGDDFVRELAQQFIHDAAEVLQELSRAVAAGDAAAFREHAHALRSGAANLGARGVYEMCLAWRQIEPATLSSNGREHLAELEQELGRVSDALRGMSRA
jgi:two-component system, sensor histidine kinase RpfC